MDVVLEVQNLAKDYPMGGGIVSALRGTSLTVERGSLLVIMGASGSGKSTLLHLVGGLDVPTAGCVLIEGHDITAMTDRQRTLFRRKRLGVIFQSFNLLSSLTAVENVSLPMLINGANHRDFNARAEDLLRTVDLGHRLRHRPTALSGGEQQRVAIARALLNSPALVLADEPTGNLDSKHGEEIWQLLRRLVDEDNRTVVAVTHEPAARHADRIVVLKDGLIAGDIDNARDMDASLVATRYTQLAG